mmetsp:Transcript_133022/g.331958  ORF Transcript_133022/g.331958 Transcript_133022/m.331958 type:complete len:294 (+) Transcript_133022:897-1778(+)
MHDVAASDGDIHLQDVLVVLVQLTWHAHPFQKIPDLLRFEHVERQRRLQAVDLGLHGPGIQVWVDDLLLGLNECVARIVVRINNLHGLHCEGLVAMLREHGHNGVQRDLCLCEVSGGHFDENVLSLKPDLGMLTVDDRRQRENCAIAVIDHWKHWAVLDDRQICFQLLVSGEHLHQPVAIHLLCLIERHKTDVFRWQGLVGKRRLEGGQVVRANGDERSLAANVLVQLVLQVNETLVPIRIELDTPQHCAHTKRPDLRRGSSHSHPHVGDRRLLGQLVPRWLHLALEDLQSAD